MKLSISDWQKAANARVLIGIIAGLNAKNNTATVIIATGTVADVPIHYVCNHNEANHAASRVFIEGDQVVILYTGNTAAPSADNLTVLGLKDEIRRCREAAGILAALLRSDGTPAGATSGNRLFAGLTATQPDPLPLGGNNWWTDGTVTISWQTFLSGRYARGSNAGGSEIYMQGVLVASGKTVSGAAVRAELGGEKTLLLVDDSGKLWKKTLFSGPVASGWTLLHELPIAVHSPNHAVNFDSTATKAVGLCDYTPIGGTLNGITNWTISGDSITAVYTDMFQQDVSSWSKAVAADYKGESLVVATVTFTRTITTTENSGAESLVCGDYDKSEYTISYSTSQNNVTQNLWMLSWGTVSAVLGDIQSENHYTGTTYEFFFDGDRSDIMGAPYVFTRSIKSAVTGVVVGMDLRSDLLAMYHQEFSAVVYDQETCTNENPVDGFGRLHPENSVITHTWDSGLTMRRFLTFNGLETGPSESCYCPSKYVPAPGKTQTSFLYGASSVQGFDLLTFTQGEDISYNGVFEQSVNSTTNSPVQLTGAFQHAASRTDSLTTWRTSYSTALHQYTGGNIETITGLAGPLFANSLKVI